MGHHDSSINLRISFDDLWQLLHHRPARALWTLNGHLFDASASTAVKTGAKERQKVVLIKKAGIEFGRIYSCCWGHTTNCYGKLNGTRIGGYSRALDTWARR